MKVRSTNLTWKPCLGVIVFAVLAALSAWGLHVAAHASADDCSKVNHNGGPPCSYKPQESTHCKYKPVELSCVGFPNPLTTKICTTSDYTTYTAQNEEKCDPSTDPSDCCRYSSDNKCLKSVPGTCTQIQVASCTLTIGVNTSVFSASSGTTIGLQICQPMDSQNHTTVDGYHTIVIACSGS